MSQESAGAEERLWPVSRDFAREATIARKSWENDESPEGFILEAFVNRFSH